MGTNGILVEERTSLGLQLYAKLVEFLWLQMVPGKERISPGLQLYAKLVGCLWVQMVSLSKNGFHLAFGCMLNWLVDYGYKWYPCQTTDFTWPSIVC